ncbi:hypothetical protein [Heyndrickxia ginsengihumi]|uniref:hypothetical protein n=1 Tax=Heyndrickxia ginsengihumi TaxID=363870 RepID=UPI000A9054DE|nr:hypothetical protein [Heyndrickxia ginsengihumi]
MINLDNTNIKEINLSVSERPEIPTPEQDIEHIEVRGRNGSLTKNMLLKTLNIK